MLKIKFRDHQSSKHPQEWTKSGLRSKNGFQKKMVISRWGASKVRSCFGPLICRIWMDEDRVLHREPLVTLELALVEAIDLVGRLTLPRRPARLRRLVTPHGGSVRCFLYN